MKSLRILLPALGALLFATSPILRAADDRPDGPPPGEEVAQLVSSRRGYIQRCYERSAKRNPQLAGDQHHDRQWRTEALAVEAHGLDLDSKVQRLEEVGVHATILMWQRTQITYEF